MLGLPGAGKSGLAKRLAEEHNFAWVHDNRIRFELFSEPAYSQEQELLINRVCDYTLDELLRTKGNITFNGNTLSRNTRINLSRKAKKNGYRTITVWLQTDAETAFRRRNKQNEELFTAPITRSLFDKYSSKFSVPRPPESYIVLSGKHNHQMQLRNLIAKLQMIDQPTESKDIKKSQLKTKQKPSKNQESSRKLPEAPDRPNPKKRQRLDITRQIKIR